MKTEEPIRIAQIIGKWLGGGVESVVMNYYRNIDRSKIQFDFICDDDSTNIPYDEIESLGGKVILIPPYQKVFKYHKELKRVLKEGNYKIVHSHINTLSVFSLCAAWSAKVPVRIAHSHSVIVNNKREFKRNVIKHILKHFSKIFATNYLACSDMAAISQFGKRTFNKGKVMVLNNAIDLDLYQYNENVRIKIRKEYNIYNDTFVLGHIGRFVETKNHEFIIDVFNSFHKKYENSVLILIGDGPLKKNMINRVNSLGLKNSVLFLGQKKNANEFYQAFDSFVFPSLYEGLGMALIEAQCSGLYCFSSDTVPYNAKIIDNFKFLNINSAPDDWADMIYENINYNRNDNFDFNFKSFDIKEEQKKLFNYYKNLLK